MRSALDEIRRAAGQGGSIDSAARRFHRALVAATHNAYFDSLFLALHDQADTRCSFGVPAVGAASCGWLRQACLEYEALAQSIEGRDASTARACMRVHLSNRKARAREARIVTAVAVDSR